MHQIDNIKSIEYKIFNTNRFALSSKEKNEIVKDLKNSKILIVFLQGQLVQYLQKKS